MFKKAVKQQCYLRLALIGISGSGKTYSALNIATHLGGSIAVIDTERGSASKYADIFDFDVVELQSFAPQRYIEAIQAAEKTGYNILIIDSLSHAWSGKDGILEFVDHTAKRMRKENTFSAWREATPLHNRLVDAMLDTHMHLIVTMRAKAEYVVESVMDSNGKYKAVPRKVGMQPIQRDGLEYETDLVADLDLDNNFIVSKSRCPQLQGQVINRPGKEVADILSRWLSAGVPMVAKPSDATTITDDTLPSSSQTDRKAKLIARIMQLREQEIALGGQVAESEMALEFDTFDEQDLVEYGQMARRRVEFLQQRQQMEKDSSEGLQSQVVN